MKPEDNRAISLRKIVQHQISGLSMAEFNGLQHRGWIGQWRGGRPASFMQLHHHSFGYVSGSEAGHEGLKGDQFQFRSMGPGDQDIQLDGKEDFFLRAQLAGQFDGHALEILRLAERPAV